MCYTCEEAHCGYVVETLVKCFVRSRAIPWEETSIKNDSFFILESLHCRHKINTCMYVWLLLIKVSVERI